MIKIEERKTVKMPGKTSLFLNFQYNADIIFAIKEFSDVYNYNKDTHEWEIPITCLSRILPKLCEIDQVILQYQEEKKLYKKEIILNTESYKTKPFDYQADAIKYGLSHDKWMLLDAPGLGKTLTMIYLAQELKERENIKHCFIVCGINTLKMNWKMEIEKHSNLSCKILGERINKKGKYTIGSVQERLEDLKNPIDEFFIITNIETLRDDKIIKQLTNKKSSNIIDMIVLDEAHVIKDQQSKQAKNLLKFKSKYQVALTGTLLINSPLDSYVALKWIGEERSNQSTFKYYYCNLSMFGELISYKNIDVLQNQLDSCSLRRTKDILDLPPKIIVNEFIEMDDKQSKFYQNIVDGVVSEVDKVEINSQNLLGLCTRLRQAVDCPAILTTENISSAKIQRTIQLIEESVSNDEKVVVFSVFKEPLNILYKELKKYNPLLCTGDIKDEIISQNIQAFQNEPNKKVMLCTISKMGTGITLTASSYEIFLSSSYTSAQNLQAEDRCYRIGSKKPVTIFYLWTKGTIDERVKEIVEDKSLISEYIIDKKCSPNMMQKLKQIIMDLGNE